MNRLDLINEIERRTGMSYSKQIISGNICYMQNNKDLQDAFKQIFTDEDLDFFLKSFQNEDIILPKDHRDFWETVRKGTKK